MTEIVFQLMQTPSGKWHLKRGEQSFGFYESPAKGEEAIKILVSPTIKHYDINGDEIR